MAQGNIPRMNIEEAPEQAVEAKNNRGDLSFEEIYKLHGERVLNLAYRFTRGGESARDMTQEIFVKVYQNLATFREQSEVYTWIHRIAVNHILNYLKQEKRHRWLSLMEENVGELLHDEKKIEATFRSRFSPPRPDHIIEASEREKIVRSAVESLPVKYRVPFELYRFEGMSYQEIADIMNLSLSAVEARIHRAKKKIIKTLEPWLNNI